jgi:hypothetical protein
MSLVLRTKPPAIERGDEVDLTASFLLFGTLNVWMYLFKIEASYLLGHKTLVRDEPAKKAKSSELLWRE